MVLLRAMQERRLLPTSEGRIAIGWLIIEDLFMVATLVKKPLSQPVMRVAGMLLMSLCTSGLVAAMLPGVSSRPEGAGGLVAIFLASELAYRFNSLGTVLILGIAFWIGAILAMDQVVLTVARWLGQGMFALTQMKWPKPVLVGVFGGKRDQLTMIAPGSASLRNSTKPSAPTAEPDDALDDFEDPDRASTTLVVDEDEDDEIEKHPGTIVPRGAGSSNTRRAVSDDEDDESSSEIAPPDGPDAPRCLCG
ncbi:MAG: hypothetical protein HC898_00155 [Phycisphaerales bacterium]|nr:hypothetical protein [Phycisphaerales bacterium]